MPLQCPRVRFCFVCNVTLRVNSAPSPPRRPLLLVTKKGRELHQTLDLLRPRPTRNSSRPAMLDSSTCSRVSLLVVTLGLICTCCDSFLMRPAGPHSSSMGQHAVRGVSRLTTGGAGRATRMMAGDLDVSLVCLFCCRRADESGHLLPPPPPR